MFEGLARGQLLEIGGRNDPVVVALRNDHVQAYWLAIVFCHSASWRDDPDFTQMKMEQLLADSEMAMFKLLHKYGC